jgi:hypothetical protein
MLVERLASPPLAPRGVRSREHHESKREEV